jgi:hypothetical protein
MIATATTAWPRKASRNRSGKPRGMIGGNVPQTGGCSMSAIR